LFGWEFKVAMLDRGVDF